jgi:hypothetical protein
VLIACLCCLSDISLTFRLETDSSIPVRNQFSGIFDKFGDDVWDKWDEFLKNAEVHGKSKKGIMTYLLLIQANRRGWSYSGDRQKCAMATSS